MYTRYSETVTKRNRFITNKNTYKTMNIDMNESKYRCCGTQRTD